MVNIPGKGKNNHLFAMEEYHVVNLRWLLEHVMFHPKFKELNTGDWAGELLWSLQAVDLNTEIEPNGNPDIDAALLTVSPELPEGELEALD